MRGNANCWDAAVTMATSITSSNQNEGGGLEPPSCSERLDETKISAVYESVVLISDGTAGKMCDHDEELVAKRFDDASPSTTKYGFESPASTVRGHGSGRDLLTVFMKQDSRHCDDSGGGDNDSVKCASPVEANLPLLTTNPSSCSTSSVHLGGSTDQQQLSALRIDSLPDDDHDENGGDNSFTEYRGDGKKGECSVVLVESDSPMTEDDGGESAESLRCHEPCASSCLDENEVCAIPYSDSSDVRRSDGQHDSSSVGASPTSVHAWLENAAKMLEIHLQQRRQHEAQGRKVDTPESTEHDEQCIYEESEGGEEEIVEQNLSEPPADSGFAWDLALHQMIQPKSNVRSWLDRSGSLFEDHLRKRQEHLAMESHSDSDCDNGIGEEAADDAADRVVQTESNVRSWLDSSGSLFEDHLRKRQEHLVLETHSDSVCDNGIGEESDETGNRAGQPESNVRSWLDRSGSLFEDHLRRRQGQLAIETDSDSVCDNSISEDADETEIEIVDDLDGLSVRESNDEMLATSGKFSEALHGDAGALSDPLPATSVGDWLEKSSTLLEEHLLRRQREQDQIYEAPKPEQKHLSEHNSEIGHDDSFLDKGIQDCCQSAESPASAIQPKLNSPNKSFSLLHSASQNSVCHESAVSDPNYETSCFDDNKVTPSFFCELPEQCDDPPKTFSQEQNVRDWLETSAVLLEKHFEQKEQCQDEPCCEMGLSVVTSSTKLHKVRGGSILFDQDSASADLGAPSVSDFADTPCRRANHGSLDLEVKDERINDHPKGPSPPGIFVSSHSMINCTIETMPTQVEQSKPNVREWLESRGKLLELHLQQRRTPTHSLRDDIEDGTVIEEILEDYCIETNPEAQQIDQEMLLKQQQIETRARNKAPPQNVSTWLNSTANMLDKHLEQRKQSFNVMEDREAAHAAESSDADHEDVETNDTPALNVSTWLKSTACILDKHLEQRQQSFSVLESRETEYAAEVSDTDFEEVETQEAPASNVSTWLQSTASMLDKHLEQRQQKVGALNGREADHAAETSESDLEEVETLSEPMFVDSSENSSSDSVVSSSSEHSGLKTSGTSNLRSWLASTEDVLESMLLKRPQTSVGPLHHDTDSSNDSQRSCELDSAESDGSTAQLDSLALNTSNKCRLDGEAMQKPKIVPGSKNLRAWLESTANQLERKIQQRQIDYCKSVHLDAGDEASEDEEATADDRSECPPFVPAELDSVISPALKVEEAQESEEAPSSTAPTASGNGTCSPSKGEDSVPHAIPAAPYSFSAVSVSFLAFNVKTSTAMKVFEEALRILRPGGRVYLVDYDGRTVNKLPSDWRKILTRVEQFDPIEMQVHGMQEEEIRKILSCMGRSSTKYLEQGYTMARWVGVVPLDFSLF